MYVRECSAFPVSRVEVQSRKAEIEGSLWMLSSPVPVAHIFFLLFRPWPTRHASWAALSLTRLPVAALTYADKLSIMTVQPVLPGYISTQSSLRQEEWQFIIKLGYGKTRMYCTTWPTCRQMTPARGTFLIFIIY